MLSRGSFELSIAAVWPLVWATLGYFIYRAGSEPASLLYVSLGATVMAIWSMVAMTAGGAIQRQRWLGTLELMVAAPMPFVVVLVPITVASSALGIYAFFATIVFGRLLFGIPVTIEHPVAFVLALPTVILSIGILGLLMASVMVRYRNAGTLSSSLEYPVWLLAGLLMPLALLPDWVHPISWALAPTWGVRALREAALGGSPYPDLALCVAITVGYALLAIVSLRSFERLARERATLSLT
jgi:ABC-2 type transport system permease protein